MRDVQKQRIAPLISVQVTLNVSLRIEHESINSVPLGKVANVIRDHTVQPAYAVFARHVELRPGCKFEDAAALGQCGELGAHAGRICVRDNCGFVGVLNCRGTHNLNYSEEELIRESINLRTAPLEISGGLSL